VPPQAREVEAEAEEAAEGEEAEEAAEGATTDEAENAAEESSDE
jgi:hypothetical protein